ncbi:hypothetical protein HDU87_006170 [Geranomyces variabilis]|uniref:Uncharacterized protein n=1 Tax=Geranomyces variabilis TaxID=109894 RepID=A0AAD5TGJ2_9FUNG|nr:hypothetical protein HDU87_006170 [Geranomyces variabilis]
MRMQPSTKESSAKKIHVENMFATMRAVTAQRNQAADIEVDQISATVADRIYNHIKTYEIRKRYDIDMTLPESATASNERLKEGIHHMLDMAGWTVVLVNIWHSNKNKCCRVVIEWPPVKKSKVTQMFDMVRDRTAERNSIA